MAAPQHPFELYAIDSLFNDEQLAMRDAVRKFVDDRIKPHVGQWFEDGEFPARELAKEIGQMGMLRQFTIGLANCYSFLFCFLLFPF